VLEALLYDVPVTDPETFATVVVLLTGLALFASWILARRAGDTDPASVMREE